MILLKQQPRRRKGDEMIRPKWIETKKRVRPYYFYHQSEEMEE